MKIRILGSAAGGGLPQWNCFCSNCSAARAGSPDVQPRTQSSVAVSADGVSWLLLNVSPDIRQQILSTPELGLPGNELGISEGAPAIRIRSTNIAGCILTDAEIDHTFGLFLLREGGTLAIASTPIVRQWLNQCFSMESTLSSFAERPWHELSLDQTIDGSQISPNLSGLRIRAFAVDAHQPRFVLECGSHAAALPAQAMLAPQEDSVIGLEIKDVSTSTRFVYAPCLASMHANFLAAARDADAIFMDGTFWSDDELIRLGVSDRTAREMGHLPVGGEGGSLARFSTLPARHKAYIHINNTNPVLNRTSREYDEVIRSGICVAADGDLFEI